MIMIGVSGIVIAVIALSLVLGEVGCTGKHGRKGRTAFAAGNTEVECVSPCTMKNDTILAHNAVSPSWIAWESPCLPNADLAYVDLDTWNIWVMDELGGNKRCLTCYDDNILGVNFPLDDDGRAPAIHWKGDPEAHPTEPIVFFKASSKPRMRTVSTGNCGTRRASAGTTTSGR